MVEALFVLKEAFEIYPRVYKGERKLWFVEELSQYTIPPGKDTLPPEELSNLDKRHQDYMLVMVSRA